MKDLLYYYDKSSLFGQEFGEIQTNFNMSFVIDGTKDSCKVNVISYVEKEITPNTIVFHIGTQTWWIVSNDKVSRYENESGYMYIHELQLEGAIELLNARDLTDCGFNSNRYNVGDFIKRLFALSNFELPITINTQYNLSLDKNVDYVKTFENYTLLSALREFLDGYNCVAKLSFVVSGQVLTSAILTIVSKTGNSNTQPLIADNVFKDIREIKNSNKSNYGTSVISNAENVISTKTKTYPSIGGVKLSSQTNTINGQTAILRLPSNAFKVNYLDMYGIDIVLHLAYQGSDIVIAKFDTSDPSSCQNAIDELIDRLDGYVISDSVKEEIAQAITIEKLQAYTRRFYYCDNYNPVSQQFTSNERFVMGYFDYTDVQMCLTNKELGQTIEHPNRCMWFIRGNNTLEHFYMYEHSGNKEAHIYGYNRDEIVLYETNDNGSHVGVFIGNALISGGTIEPMQYQLFSISNSSFSVNYIPMADLKIKMDNYGDTIDSVLYNQNGKLNDSNSLSKVLLSYVKEIESDIITRYGTYYGKYMSNTFDKGGLPSVGDMVLVNNDYYVVNNISIDFAPNESNDTYSIGYYMTAEVSLSKKVATKSLLTSPNTNIRDYGIPQNNNVKRKQLYRDFYEFDYETIYNQYYTPNWVQPLDNVLNLSVQPNDYKEHIAVIKTTFENLVNNSKVYYYQLETTTYYLKKSLYEVLDFKDNNIIGYGFQNKWSGFDLSKIFISGNNDNYNTPISYVDDSGEIKKLNIKFATIDNITEAYDNLTSGTAYEDMSVYNASVFIPQSIYDYISASRYDYKIDEESYEKDALEVPVFEYSCQVDDSENVIVGENILSFGNNDKLYMYSYVIALEGFYDDNNYLNLSASIPSVSVENGVATLTNVSDLSGAIVFDTTHIHDNIPYIELYLYENISVDTSDYTITYGDRQNLYQLMENRSLIVVRHNLTEEDINTNIVGELATTTIQSTLPTPNATYKNKVVVLSDGTYALCTPDSYSLTFNIGTDTYVKLTLVRNGEYVMYDEIISEDTTLTVYEDDEYWWSAHCVYQGYYLTGDTVGGSQASPLVISGSNYSYTTSCATISFTITCNNCSATGTYHSTIDGGTETISIASGSSQVITCGYGGSYSIDLTPNTGYSLSQSHYEQSNITTPPSNLTISATPNYYMLRFVNSTSETITLTNNLGTINTTIPSQSSWYQNYIYNTNLGIITATNSNGIASVSVGNLTTNKSYTIKNITQQTTEERNLQITKTALKLHNVFNAISNATEIGASASQQDTFTRWTISNVGGETAFSNINYSTNNATNLVATFEVIGYSGNSVNYVAKYYYNYTYTEIIGIKIE